MNFKALLVGQYYLLTAAPVTLLRRAGFSVDLVLLKDRGFQGSLFDSVHLIDDENEFLDFLIDLNSKFSYDLVVVGDDEMLRTIKASGMPDDIKSKLLPVLSTDDWVHLYSKIGLKRVLEKNRIRTPRSLVVKGEGELLDYAINLGYPLLVKLDGSGGGVGVFECLSDADVVKNKARFTYPLLIQKKIEGEIIDLSAFYQNGKLIHFTYSEFLKSEGEFGPSSLRKYTQLSIVERKVFDELGALGVALGANGFANVTAIRSNVDGENYFFEADMRPNVWADFGRFIGNDASGAIRECFLSGQALSYPQPINSCFPLTIQIPYLRRLSLWDLLFNKYNCWIYFGKDSQFFGSFKLLLFHKCLAYCGRMVKPFVPDYLWIRIRSICNRHLGF